MALKQAIMGIIWTEKRTDTEKPSTARQTCLYNLNIFSISYNFVEDTEKKDSPTSFNYDTDPPPERGAYG